MSDFYYDDPVEESTGKRKNFRGILALILLFVAGGAYVQTTLAANISLNSGSPVEFGQGVAMTAACSGANFLTVTPNSEFVNSSGAGAHYLKSITVTGIPAECNGKDFNISLYDNVPNSGALPIFGTSKTVATIYNNAGNFEQGFQGTGSTISSSSGGFTVTFTSPVALSSTAMKITLQSSEHIDWAVGSISNGQSFSCTLLNSSAVKCWGVNSDGQLGDGTITNRYTPIAVSGLSSDVSAITSRYSHACALLNSGAVKCWGSNFRSHLGDGTNVAKSTPVAVSGLSSGVSAISAGNGHTCALLKTGGVKCWGDAGKTGDGTAIERNAPVAVTGLSSGVIAISAAGYHTCALLSTGAVKCWGSENNGTLGNGGGGDSPGNALTGLSAGVIALASGERHTCALLSTGGVQCWGQNAEGQLGNGTTSAGSSNPVTVSGISNAVAISGGFNTTCALLSTGVVKCWGRNLSGQLGNGTLVSSSTPVTVSGISSAVAIANGYYHACALLTSGAAKCWGYNASGQLGNGTTTDSSTQVSVTGIP